MVDFLADRLVGDMDSGRPIAALDDINARARKLEVDNRIPLDSYYRIASNLLKQASIYREERNVIDLYIILLRFTSLILETIPFHRDYHSLLASRRTIFKKKLVEAITELETLKPIVQRQIDERSRSSIIPTQTYCRPNSQETEAHFSSYHTKAEPMLQKLSLSLPLPKEETLSRHSVFGQNGLHAPRIGRVSNVKASYPSSSELTSSGSSSELHQAEQSSEGQRSLYESVISLDDGRLLYSLNSSHIHELRIESSHENNAHHEITRQPSPPPLLTRVQPNSLPISPSKVADPRPGHAKTLHDTDSKTFQQLHISPILLDNFLKIAQKNTVKNLETCGVLAGSLKNRTFHVTTLIIPKQDSTSDSCQTKNEEEIFEVQDKLSLFPLGWIHTHPSQTCFMSSIDLHTHYSYQVMLPEAIAIVMAPTDESSPHGIFHLSDPGGVSVIRHCQERGFHPHEEPSDGSTIYEHCSHVYMNLKLKFDVVDLR